MTARGDWVGLCGVVLAAITLIEPANVFARSNVKFKLTVLALLPGARWKLTRRAMMAWAFGNPAGGRSDVSDRRSHRRRRRMTSARSAPVPRRATRTTRCWLPCISRRLSCSCGRSVYHDAVAAEARARQLVPAGQVELWPTATHAVAAERPDEVNNHILEFVQSVDRV
ncbi:alpha/beta fold hydrolase [Antrihabitans sp. YC2-6]|uniref:alpha/beta fold hydrolase n=1 Tax=Antrihabitans sp. YC2-6 TaxID=2799498 RepID=UPI0018F5204B|nr:hypothetical protein [Antrihabitans sp. YC2-6]MBJ8344474.1 hypothetical protein [Antrihabitans sp. YC2-6]